MLGEDGQQVTLQDLGRPQLLPYIPRLILMPQVTDQIFHTLFRHRTKHADRTWLRLPARAQGWASIQANETFYFYIFILFERKRSTHWCTLLNVYSNQSWARPKPRAEELNWGLPHEWQGLKHVSHHLLPPRVHNSQEAGSEVEERALEPDTPKTCNQMSQAAS